MISLLQTPSMAPSVFVLMGLTVLSVVSHKNSTDCHCEYTYHDLMKNCSGAVIHLVKLINAADTIVTQNKCTTVGKEKKKFRNQVKMSGNFSRSEQ